MVALLLLGAWVAFAPDVPQAKRDGATRVRMNVGSVKGAIDWLPARPASAAGVALPARDFVVHYRDGTSVGPRTAQEMEAILGPQGLAQLTRVGSSDLFRLLNVTSWLGVLWVAAGFGGQLAFSGRWLLQWFVSEKSKSSTVPVAFWWMSLVGSVILFAYFAWRQDLVGTLGQTSGVVIYARNIRLIHKQRRREARARRPAQPQAPVQQRDEGPAKADELPPSASA
jgi:lipid-A-disaccharide synthase-like uncharacterized protein